MSEESVRVFLVDDHEVVRDGIRMALDIAGGFSIVGEAASVDVALPLILTTEPDVAIVDARLPGGSGQKLIRHVRTRKPQIRCLVLTSYPGRDALYQAVVCGASGYLAKDVPSATLVKAIRLAHAGESVLEWNSLAEDAFVDRPSPAGADLIAELTPQEQRILGLIAEGRTNREIAAALCLADKTVRNYVSNILGKLGVKNRTQAATLVVGTAAHHTAPEPAWMSA